MKREINTRPFEIEATIVKPYGKFDKGDKVKMHVNTAKELQKKGLVKYDEPKKDDKKK